MVLHRPVELAAVIGQMKFRLWRWSGDSINHLPRASQS